MPRYSYQCPACLEILEVTRSISLRNRRPKCPACPNGKMERNIGLERCGTDTQDYVKPIESHRMGVSPNQVAEHRRRFPEIPMTDTGEIIVRNGAEERRINRVLAGAFGKR